MLFRSLTTSVFRESPSSPDCTSNYKGTTASSASQVAGIVTLMLQANQLLSWRYSSFKQTSRFSLFLLNPLSFIVFLSLSLTLSSPRDVQHILIESADHKVIGLYDLSEDGDDFSVGEQIFLF